MVWAPSATYDPESKVFYVFWASKFYDTKDTNHSKDALTANQIRVCKTTDFKTFSTPQTYLDRPDEGLIDQDFQYLGQSGHFSRFIKSEKLSKVYQEVTTDGIMSKNAWIRIGGSTGYVTEDLREGPASFQDNLNPNLYHLWLDNYSGMGGYEPYETRSIVKGGYAQSNAISFPRGIRHGSVTPVTQMHYE